MAGVPLAVSNTKGALGAIADLGPAQDGARTFSLVNPAGATGDQVMILGGNEADMSDSFLVGNVYTTNTLAGGADGQNSALSSTLVFRYCRTLRVAVSSSPAVVCEAGVAEPSGGGGAPAILDGGQSGPLTAGTTDATSFSLFAGSITQAVMLGNGNSTWGSAAAGDTTTLQSGGAMGLNAGTTLGMSGGTGLTATATTGNASFSAPSGNASVDAFTTASLGASTAANVTAGGTNVTGLWQGFIGAGGKMRIGSAIAAYSGTADSIGVVAGGNGPVTVSCRAAGTGLLTLAGGSGGASLDAPGAVTVAGTSATSATIGNTTGTMTLALKVGTGLLDLTGGATDHTTTVGSTTGASPTGLQAGTGALTLRRNGVTWTWPSADATNTAGQTLVSNAAGALSFGKSIQSGTQALTNGTATVSTANISATSRIFAFLKTASGVTLTVQYIATTRANGTPGSFVLQANIAAGTINVADQSTLDWLVVDN